MAKSSLTGELIHFGATRFRVTGTGNLQLILFSLDDVNTYNLPNIIMSSTTAIEPLVLGNFISQRGCLLFGTSAINETFTMEKITFYVKAVATGIPQ